MTCKDLTCATNRWKLRATLRAFAYDLADMRCATLRQAPEIDELLTRLAGYYRMGECPGCLEARLAGEFSGNGREGYDLDLWDA